DGGIQLGGGGTPVHVVHGAPVGGGVKNGGSGGSRGLCRLAPVHANLGGGVAEDDGNLHPDRRAGGAPAFDFEAKGGVAGGIREAHVGAIGGERPGEHVRARGSARIGETN